MSSLPSVRGEKVTLWLLTHGTVILRLGEPGLLNEALRYYRSVFNRTYGAVVVTGSGKSTTLYVTSGELNAVESNIAIIGDPIGYRMEGITQIHPPA